MASISEDIDVIDDPRKVYGKCLHGKGKVVFKNGNTYEGEFEYGMFHGKGTFTWTTDVIYKGDFEHNIITGMGEYKWPDNSWYKGEVLNGLRHGKGIYETGWGEIRYEGQWKKGLRHGKGKMSFKSGGVYEGEFLKGYKCGWGKMIYPSGNFYEGEWAFEKKDGFGTTNWVNSKEKVRIVRFLFHLASIMGSEKTTSSQGLVFTSGLKNEAPTKFSETATKDTGSTDKDRVSAAFTMQMEQNTRVNGASI